MKEKLQHVEMWISGPQGTGKTHIMPTLRDYFKKNKLLYRVIEEDTETERNYVEGDPEKAVENSRRPLWTVRVSNVEPEQVTYRPVYQKKNKKFLRVDHPVKTARLETDSASRG